jgi:predicted transcriptional regulator
MYGERGSVKARKRINQGRRSSLDVIADILDTSRRGIKKTHLIYNCRLSFGQLQKYLDLMLKTRLLFVEDNGPHLLFRISGKGRSFLKCYENLKDLME